MIDYSCRIIGLANTPDTFEEDNEVYDFKIVHYGKKRNKHPSATDISV